MLKSFPSISTNSQIPIENLCVGESYYINTKTPKSSLSYGKITESNEHWVCVEGRRSISENSTQSSTKYLKTDHEFSTYQSFGFNTLTELNVCFAVDPFNEEMSIGMTGNVISVRKVITGDQVAVLGDISRHDTMTCLCYSPNGKYLAAGSTDGNLYLWNNVNKQLIHKVFTIAQFVSSITFNADNNFIIMHSLTRASSHIWSIDKRDFVSSLAITKYTPTQLFLSSPMKNLFDDNIYASAVTYNLDGSIVAMVATININRSVVAQWRAVDKRFVLLSIQDYEDHYTSISFSPSGKKLMLCSESGTISILNSEDLSVDEIFEEPTPIHSVNYSPSGRYIVTCGTSRGVRVLNAETRELVADFTGDLLEDYEEDYDGVVSAMFSKDETKLVVCFPFYIREIPWIPPAFIPDEFKTQLIAECLSGGLDLPDNAKLMICEFLCGVSVLC